uniref:Uncharacterized protein n=1 Tax=Glossina morsitans morsitans TaxID=37546 RepID=A0A1B0GF42_GLOMM
MVYTRSHVDIFGLIYILAFVEVCEQILDRIYLNDGRTPLSTWSAATMRRLGNLFPQKESETTQSVG